MNILRLVTKKLGTRLCHIFLVLLLFSLVFTPTVQAITQGDLDAIIQGTPFYEPETCDTGDTGTNPGGTVTGYPIRLPYISDPAKLSTAIDQYITQKWPGSPFIGLGKYFVDGGMRAGVNPLLVVSHGIKEEHLGLLSGAGISQGSFNTFGRSATERQPHVNGSRAWYQYPSWEESLYAKEFPASSFTGHPDDQFQYIARVYANNLDFGLESYLDGPGDLPGYAPSSDGNDVPTYAKNIVDWSNEIATMSGGAIDLAQYGTTGGSGSGTVPVAAGGSAKKVIAIDPGHGGAVAEYTDPVTKLGDRETANSPEREDMQEVANQIKTQLDSSGYNAVLLKAQADEAINKRDRINAAKFVKADLGISLHSDSSSGSFDRWAEVWPQFVGGYRQSSTDSNIKVVFNNKKVADLSNSYSDIFVEERDKAERSGSGVTKKVVGQAKYFPQTRGLPSYGDISLIQLWADDIPWVYNEVGAQSGGLTTAQKQEYAAGIVNAVKRAIPTTANEQPPAGSCGAVSGNVVATALAYAWPEYHPPDYLDRKPEYVDAVNKARAKGGEYVGGCDGVDCGGFVTRVMRDSGYAPSYNSDACNTTCQYNWLKANWTSLGMATSISTADLQPGDVAVRYGHTFMWVGEQPGFEYPIASASLCQRAPMAGKEDPLDHNHNGFEWFRKK